MALPGASGRKHQGRLEVDPYGFGVRDTEDLRPVILQLRKRYWQHMKGFQLLWKWLVLKHSSSWHRGCRCWAGCSKGGSPLHIMQLMLCGVSELAALITQWAQIGNSSHLGILELIMDWPKGKDFGILPEEEVLHAEEVPLYNKLPENEKQYALFTDGSCQTAEEEGESRQFADVKAIQLALDIAEREKWPVLYLYTDSRMVANALWGWLQQWKQNNWHRRGKPIWAATSWQDIAARVENLVVKATGPVIPAPEQPGDNVLTCTTAEIFCISCSSLRDRDQ
ncbi:hypothetical protein QYF61_001281, partial [Mycteria americana]